MTDLTYPGQRRAERDRELVALRWHQRQHPPKGERVCARCGPKPATAFYANPGRFCKDCVKDRAHHERQVILSANPDAVACPVCGDHFLRLDRHLRQSADDTHCQYLEHLVAPADADDERVCAICGPLPVTAFYAGRGRFCKDCVKTRGRACRSLPPGQGIECLVEGCGTRWHALARHLRDVHGIDGRTYKRLTGGRLVSEQLHDLQRAIAVDRWVKVTTEGRELSWSPERIRTALQHDAERRGRPPTAREWERKARGRPTRRMVAKVFGSWNAALVDAGFPRRPQGPTIRRPRA